MWKATIEKSEIVNGSLHVTVEITDGDYRHKKVFQTDQQVGIDWIKENIYREIEKLERVSNVKNTIPIGEVNLSGYKPKDDIFRFVKIPRTGSTSIGSALGDSSPHRTAKEIQHDVGKEKWDEMFTFAVVRNPYDRFLSAYRIFGLHMLEDPNELLVDSNKGMRTLLLSNQTLFRPQVDWVTDSKGDVMVNYVGHFENMDETWIRVKEGAGIEAELPHLAEGKHDVGELNQTSKDILYKFYKKDFDTFRYEK